MIITRTPFRISFFGGGTDYPHWYKEYGGAVLSVSINKYCYVTCRHLPPFFDCKYRIRYAKHEETQTIKEIQHPSVRECLLHLRYRRGIEMQHNSDVPGMSGLGSSSAFTVGFLNALHALRGEAPSKRDLALEAIHVEQNRIGENVGSQDQTTVAFGGLNRIDFGGEEEIKVAPVEVDRARLRMLQSHLMLLFTGFARNASEIAGEQIKQIPRKRIELKNMQTLMEEATSCLKDTSMDLREFGRMLHESWQIKRGLSSKITTPFIDETYDAAQKAGALGGKILGAGGGGFMLLFAEPELHPQIKERLKNLLHVPFKFEFSGSQVIYRMPTDEEITVV